MSAGKKGFKSERLVHVLIHAILLAGLIVVVYPFLFMIMNSVKGAAIIKNNPAQLPDFSHLNFDGYAMIFEELNFFNLFKNTAFVTVTLTALHILFNSAAGYALAKINFPGKDILFKIMLWTLMIPGTIMLIPTYILMNKFGWVDTYLPIILPAVVGVYNIFLIRQFVRGIPDDFIEAAKIDGANHGYIFFKIIIPMSVPVLTGIAVLLAMGTWNDLQTPLFYIRSEDKFTLQLALYRFSVDNQMYLLPAKYAGMTVSTIPIILLFMFFQKYFIKAFGTMSLK